MRDRIGQLALVLLAVMTVGLFTGCGYVTNGESILPSLGSDVCVENRTEDQLRVRVWNGMGTSQLGSFTVYSYRTMCDDVMSLQVGDQFTATVDPIGGRQAAPPAFRDVLHREDVTLQVIKGGLTPYANSQISPGR